MHSGLLVLDKPAGVSSRDCVDRVVRAAGDKRLKVGHAGTLDPMATGVLLIAVGEATRLVEYLHELDKRYQGEFQFGKRSDTLDSDGVVEDVSDVHVPSESELQAACRALAGPEVMQRPPRISAIKVQGQRAYDMARRGVEFDLAARPVAIHSVELQRYSYPNWQLDIHCGSGTYVRSIGRDIAASLGNSAIMTALVRSAIGPFALEHATPVDSLVNRQDIESRLLDPLAGLVAWPRIELNDFQCRAVKNGRAIRIDTDMATAAAAKPARAVTIDEAGQWVALIDIAPGGHARPVRVFQTTMATAQPATINPKHNPES